MEIRIDRNAPGRPYRRHWQFCVGGGRAHLALRTDYARQLRFIHDTLGIERVRFHGIFHDDMNTCTDLSMQMAVPGAEVFEETNFNACALAYDNVLEAGMKPFVELSFMPGKLALREPDRPVQGAFYYKPCIVPPKDTAAWLKHVQAFLGFLIHRYGIEEVRTWFFEVWNEPDLPYVFWNGTQEEYFELYAETARTLKGIDVQLKVGGPATSGSKWIGDFLHYCRENSVPVDFVSTHQYAGDPVGGVEEAGPGESWQVRMMRAGERLKSVEEKTFLKGYRAITPDKSETEDIPGNTFLQNAQRVREDAGTVPVIYTEWNENAIFSAYTNDTRKVAAYDVKAALEVESYVDASSIWCFSDIFEELHPFPQEFHGGFGLLTQHGIPKPVYHAMKMLADAGSERIDFGKETTGGEVGYAAFRKGEETQVLLFRQKMKNLALAPERVTVKIERDRAPECVTVRRVDEMHGNPLRLWEEMGAPVQLSREETEELKKRSEVLEEEWPHIYADGMVTLEANLGVNDVYFVSIK